MKHRQTTRNRRLIQQEIARTSRNLLHKDQTQHVFHMINFLRTHKEKVTVITGICRCGKLYLFRHFFKDYLLKNEPKDDHIPEIGPDQKTFDGYRDPNVLHDYVQHHTSDERHHFLFADEILVSYKVKQADAYLRKLEKRGEPC